MEMQCSFIEITWLQGCFPGNISIIFWAIFQYVTSGWLQLTLFNRDKEAAKLHQFLKKNIFLKARQIPYIYVSYIYYFEF